MTQKVPTQIYSYKKVGEHRAIVNMLAVIERLHFDKSNAYGDSWIRRGLLRGLLPNIDRKIDRYDNLTKQLYKSGELPKEFCDTLSDLAVYCLKGLTYFAEANPEQFEEWYNAVYSEAEKRIGDIRGNYGKKFRVKTDTMSGLRFVGQVQDKPDERKRRKRKPRHNDSGGSPRGEGR